MKTRVQGSGNSSARCVPKSSAAESNSQEGLALNVALVHGKTITEPFSETAYMLEDLLAGVTNVHAETDTGGPVGKEIF